MFELIFMSCVNYVCTNTVLQRDLLLDECMELQQTIDSGAGSLNCVPQFVAQTRPHTLYYKDIKFDSEGNRDE